MRLYKHSFLILFLLTFGHWAHAQYFGKNKPTYESFDFKVHESPHFEFYHYLENEEKLKELINASEHWYRMHQAVLKDTFTKKNPLILYNDHPDFQQTNTISGNIGVGTGGVTEALKNRVILPLTMTNQQTNHVLGHELVHAFQYHMILKGDSTSIRSLSNLPLWMVEGLAEYLSIGRHDSHTAMWMRDAVLQDDVPSIKNMANPKYFPYRYGQAFWAFLAGTYGDQVIEPFFMTTAQYGMETAARRVLNTNVKSLSGMWEAALKTYYEPFLNNGKERIIGKKLLSEQNAGNMNLSPVLSPNGRYVIFLSEKDLFSLDLYLADARNGKLIRKIASTTKESHLDDFSSMESAGTWSPNSKEFAFVAVKKGQNVLVIKNVENGKTIEEITIKDLPAFAHPAWSPDGKEILLSGLRQGQTDLFLLNLKTKQLQQLTNDRYAEIHPAWSVDGRQIVFATDQLSQNSGRHQGKWTFGLATFDVEKQQTELINIFPGADNLNPQIDPAGQILFLSDRDGYRNLYRYDPETGTAFQLTNLVTGISGITKYSPAFSVSRKRDRVLFSHYYDGKYTVYQSKQEELLQQEIPVDSVEMKAAILPVVNPELLDVVNTNLSRQDRLTEVPESELQEKAYQAKFKLDYVSGGAGVGVGSSPTFGTTTGLAGGVNMLFGDMLGKNQLFTGVSLNGEIQDAGGQVAYFNRNHRIHWGASLSHLPYRSGYSGYAGTDILTSENGDRIPVDVYKTQLWRTFEEKASVFAQLPLNRTLRFEAGAAFTHYHYRIDEYTDYVNSGFVVLQERNKLDAPSGQNLGSFNAAIVGDNSRMGLTAPLMGQRYRLSAEYFMGDFNFTQVVADYRKYVRIKPVSVGFRAMHWGNYGADQTRLSPLFIGSPWLVRGYNTSDFARLDEWGLSFNELTGSKVLVSNFEVRLPFTGPKQLALINSKFLFTDLNFFVDGGIAFNEFSQLTGTDNGEVSLLKAKPVFSTGMSLRLNLFGAMILEPYYAFPLRKNTRGVFGLNIIPGW